MAFSIRPLPARAVVAFVLLSVVLVLGVAGSASAGLVSVGAFSGPGSDDGLLSTPERAAVEQSSGNLFVVDSANDRVQVFAPDGNVGSYLTQLGGGVLDDPVGIAVGESGGQTTVYVSSRSNGGEIVRFESDEQPVPSFTVDAGYTSPVQGVGVGEVADFGSAIALAPNGDLWVADRGSNVVKRFDSSGAHVGGSNFDGSDSGSAFTGLLDIAVNPAGDVYVVDANGPIESGPDGTPAPSGFSFAARYTAAGGFVSILLPVGSSQRPATVAVDPLTGRVAVSGGQDAIYDNVNPTVHLFDSNDLPLEEMTLPAPATYSTVSGMAFHATADRLYVVHDYGYWSDGGSYGSAPGIQALENVDAAEVTIETATDITTTTATLNATVDPNGSETSYRFEYKLDTASDWISTPDQTIPTGTDPVAIDAAIEGLDSNRSYLFRVIASNVGGETTSGEQPFTTDAVAPTVQALAATTVKSDTAVLRARVNPHGQATSYRFEYGNTTSYGQATAQSSAGDGHQLATVQAKITGLQPGATYHYRLVATNATGTTEGDNRTFTATAAAVADGCPNASIRAAQGSTHLANCRAYEQVSPVDKNGYPVHFSRGVSIGATEVSADGDAALWASYGSFAGSPSGMPFSYRSERTTAGWTSYPVSPPPITPNPHAFGPAQATWLLASDDLTKGVFPTTDYFDPSDVNGDRDYYLDSVDGEPELVSRGNGSERIPTPPPNGQSGVDGTISGDGSTALFETGRFGAHLVPEDAGRVAGMDLYAREGSVTRLANVAPEGGLASTCGSGLGNGDKFAFSGRNALSSDGSHVVFTTPNPDGANDEPSCSEPFQVYVRIDNERTLHVSASERSVPDPEGTRPAFFQGASVDGSVLFFFSPEMLTDDAPDGGGVYRYDTLAEDLELVDGTQQGPTSSTEIFSIASDDGSSVYFVSQNQLTPDAVAGKDNLYVSVDGEVDWVAAGDGLFRTDVAHSSIRERKVYTTPDGEYLVLATSSQLTDAEHSDPETGESFDAVYLYSRSDGSLVCVSCDPAGQRPAGSDPSSDAELATTAPVERVIDDGGRSVVFVSGDQLVAQDNNLKTDVYEFSDGRLSLVSGGKSRFQSLLVGVSRDGASVLFTTTEALVGQDEDGGDLDVYAARIEGGFAGQQRRAVSEEGACQGDGCQAAAGEVVRRSPTTRSSSGHGDVRVSRASRSVRLGAVSRASRRALARTGRLRVGVRVRGRGRLSVRLSATVDGKRRLLASAARRVASSRRAVSVTLRVRGKARRELLGRAGAVVVEARLSGVSRPASRRLKLTTGAGR